ncbi:hypothetical protein M0R45_008738 [Rubus argutus]|uniref:Uncharacterized protein n=1 Tax=Rubus argutus TaxID=59490 RepID=A0AAW1Y2J6_RUBAR
MECPAQRKRVRYGDMSLDELESDQMEIPQPNPQPQQMKPAPSYANALKFASSSHYYATEDEFEVGEDEYLVSNEAISMQQGDRNESNGLAQQDVSRSNSSTTETVEDNVNKEKMAIAKAQVDSKAMKGHDMKAKQQRLGWAAMAEGSTGWRDLGFEETAREREAERGLAGIIQRRQRRLIGLASPVGHWFGGLDLIRREKEEIISRWQGEGDKSSDLITCSWSDKALPD